MKLLYEGKAKQIYETENPNEILMLTRMMPQHLMA